MNDIYIIYEKIIESEYGGEIISCLDLNEKLELEKYLYKIYERDFSSNKNKLKFDYFVSEYDTTTNNLINLNNDIDMLNKDEFIYEKKLEALSITFKNNRDQKILHYLKVKIILEYYL